MDKYQNSILNRGTIDLISDKGNGTATITDDVLTLKQNENYAIVQYTLRIINPMVESVKIGDKTFSQNGETVEVAIDFNAKEETILLKFKNGFAEPCKLALYYLYADKNVYDIKIEAAQKEHYISEMRFTCRNGIDLVNLYWQKACAEVATTEIAFYALEDKEFLISKTEYDSSQHYCAISNLAFGKYVAEITQKDNNGRVLITKRETIFLTDVYDNTNRKLASLENKIVDIAKSFAGRRF